MKKPVFLISVSGGKDSQATWLWVIEHFPDAFIVPYFADTGNEDDMTYGHLGYLERKFGKITVVRSEKYKDFSDMVVGRKGFPTRQGRFCTHELKIFPSEKFIQSWKDRGYSVVNITGVRAEESKSKKLKKPNYRNGDPWIIQPARDLEGIF